MITLQKLFRTMHSNWDNAKLSWKERLKTKGGWIWDFLETEQNEAEALHDEWMTFAKAAEKERHSEERKTKKEIEEWIASEPELVKFQKRARARYLNTQLTKAKKEWLTLRDKFVWWSRAHAPSEVLEEIQNEATRLDKRIKGYEVALKLATGRITEEEKKELITDDMIERAREYPIENLLEKGNNGRAKCCFHQGEDFNMDIRKNYAHCYVCGESGDSIKIYRQLNGSSFREAVLALQ